MKIIAILCVIILGSVIGSVIEKSAGIDTSKIPSLWVITSKFITMLTGGAITYLLFNVG